MEFKQYISKPKKPWIIYPLITIYFMFRTSLFLMIEEFSNLKVIGKLYYLFLLILLLFFGIFIMLEFIKKAIKYFLLD